MGLTSNRNSSHLRMETIREQSETLDLPSPAVELCGPHASKLPPPPSGEDVSSGRGSVDEDEDDAGDFPVDAEFAEDPQTSGAGQPNPQPDTTGVTGLVLDCCSSCNGQIRFVMMKDLPYGWEKVEDPHCGTYYIDHVNRKTQYDNPCDTENKTPTDSNNDDNGEDGSSSLQRSFNDDDIDAALASDASPPDYSCQQSPASDKESKRNLSSHDSPPRPQPSTSDTALVLDPTPPQEPFFTRDPDQLRGRFVLTSLTKSERGFGFTILGGDGTTDEFLQIKAIVPGGEACLDDKLQMGDVLVYINDRCVLGFTHEDVVSTFQSMAIGSKVTLEVCRGYPLPFDPDDPNTEFVTRVAVAPKSADISPIGDHSDFSLATIGIVKGQHGFGFTIADSQRGQRVKQILDFQRCKTLREGDRLVSINSIQVSEATHRTVVGVLSQCKRNQEAMIVIRRGVSSVDGRIPQVKDELISLSPSSRSPEIHRKGRTKSEGQLAGSNSGQYSVSAAASSSALNGVHHRPRKDVYNRSFNQNEQRLKTNEAPLRSRTPGPDVLRYHGESPVESMAQPRTNGYRSTTPGVERRPQNFGTPDFIPASRYQMNTTRSHSRAGDQAPATVSGGGDLAYSNDLYGLPISASSLQPRMVAARSHDALSHPKDRYPASVDSSGASSLGEHRNLVDLTVVLQRQDNGFGFRIIGGTEEGSQVSIGRIMPGGAADVDGRLRSGDSLVYIDGECVVDSSHRHAVACMQKAAARAQTDGRVTLAVRRDQIYDQRVPMHHDPAPTATHRPLYDPSSRPPYDPAAQGSQHPYGPGTSAKSAYPPPRGPHPVGHRVPPYQMDPRQPITVTLLKRDGEGFGFEFTMTRNGGFMINGVTENGPAGQSNRMFAGDLLIAVDDLEVPSAGLTRVADLSNLLTNIQGLVCLTIVPQTMLSFAGANSPPQPPAGVIPSGAAQNAAPPGGGVEYTAILHRGSRGFGFSIRGGREFNNMALYVLRVAEGGAADLDGRIKVSDQLLEIGGYDTSDMTHQQAIALIQDSGTTVKLRMKRPTRTKIEGSRGNFNQPEPFYPPSNNYKPSSNRHMTNERHFNNNYNPY